MQEAGTIPHWMQLALTGIASLLSGIGIDKVYNSWLNRKKPAAEVTEITVRASSNASESVMRMMDRLDAAQLTIDRLRGERDDWRARALESKEQALKANDDARAAQMFTDQLNMAAKLKGVNLSDFTPQQLNPPRE